MRAERIHHGVRIENDILRGIAVRSGERDVARLGSRPFRVNRGTMIRLVVRHGVVDVQRTALNFRPAGVSGSRIECSEIQERKRPGAALNDLAAGEAVSFPDILRDTAWESAGITVPSVKAAEGYYFTGWNQAIPSDPVTRDWTFVAQYAPKTAITLTAASAAKPYDSTPLVNGNYTHNGSGIQVAATVVGSQLYVGKSDNVITPGSVTITKGGVDVTGQYDITLVPGTLEVTKANALVITMGNFEKVYGEADPTREQLLAKVTVAGLVGDTIADLNIQFTREPGEGVGTYKYTIAYDTTVTGKYEAVVVAAGVLWQSSTKSLKTAVN